MSLPHPNTAENRPPTRTWLRPESVFLVLGLVFGLALLAANAPFQSPDEPEHFFRAFQLSEGTVVGEKRGDSSGGNLPFVAQGAAYTEEIPFHPEHKMTRELFRKKFRPLFTDWPKEPRGWAHFPHTVIYPPISYVPQAGVLWVARHLRVGPLLLLYLGRLTVLALYILTGYAAIRRMPVFRWSMLVVLIAPMALYIGGSIAPDGLLIGGGFLLAALTAEVAIDRAVAPHPRDLTLLLALGAFLTLAKAVYFPVACAAALLAFTRLATPRQRILFVGAFLLTCVLPPYVWSKVVQQVYTVGRDGPIDPAAQAHVILAHPWRFLLLIGRTFAGDGRGIYEWFVGTLGWGDTPLPQWYYALFTAGLLVCVGAEAGDNRLGGAARLVCVLAAVAAVILIFVAQYLTWNAPGSQGNIEGICGRYFLPIAPFLLLAVPRVRRLRPAPRVAAVCGSLLTVTGSVVCVVALVLRFYVG